MRTDVIVLSEPVVGETEYVLLKPFRHHRDAKLPLRRPAAQRHRQPYQGEGKATAKHPGHRRKLRLLCEGLGRQQIECPKQRYRAELNPADQDLAGILLIPNSIANALGQLLVDGPAPTEPAQPAPIIGKDGARRYRVGHR